MSNKSQENYLARLVWHVSCVQLCSLEWLLMFVFKIIRSTHTFFPRSSYVLLVLVMVFLVGNHRSGDLLKTISHMQDRPAKGLQRTTNTVCMYVHSTYNLYNYVYIYIDSLQVCNFGTNCFILFKKWKYVKKKIIANDGFLQAFRDHGIQSLSFTIIGVRNESVNHM